MQHPFEMTFGYIYIKIRFAPTQLDPSWYTERFAIRKFCDEKIVKGNLGKRVASILG